MNTLMLPAGEVYWRMFPVPLEERLWKKRRRARGVNVAKGILTGLMVAATFLLMMKGIL